MIDLYFWPTPNGYKVLQFLEESNTPYRILPVDINKDEQFNPEFLKISPNNKIPVIVDHDPLDEDEPITVFESGAILIYLAEKSGRFIPHNQKARAELMQWLFWQVGGLGPAAGQSLHFIHSANEILPYASDRFVCETSRLFNVMDRQLSKHEFLIGDYSIADMACYPWVRIYKPLQQNLGNFPNLKRWYEQIKARPQAIKAYEIGAAISDKSAAENDSAYVLLKRTKDTLNNVNNIRGV